MTPSSLVASARPSPHWTIRVQFAVASLVLTVGLIPAWAQEQVLVESGTALTYLANGSDPGLGSSWVAIGFDDSGWSTGTYGVGYESSTGAENLIRTVVPADSASVYTRAVFAIDDVSQVTRLELGVDYDDGYVVWINGVEVFRSPEMPAGAPAWNTAVALHESSNGFEPSYQPIEDISTTGIPLLQNGTNVLAVGAWNAGIPSSDLVLVPRLVANRALTLVRGPYLQLGTPSGVTIRWRTDPPETSRVVYGTDPAALDTTVEEAQQAVADHVVALDGLLPDTRYYYAIGDATTLLVGGDHGHSFVTAPTPGTARPMRIWVLGDSGLANQSAREVRNAYQSFTGSTPTDLWLMLGDNAYPAGTDPEYQQALFDVYPEMLRRSVLWPTIGNHDAFSADSLTQSGPYYDIFTLPTNAEAGGVSSATEAYYSFDFGNVHYIVLDSSGSDRSAGSPMLTWLEQDLLSTFQDWIVAFWHHPPYSKGSHDSDNPSGTDLALVEMRAGALPILEDHGVDLVLSGHSHSYERSFLIDGHYGDSSSFNATMTLDGGDGRQAGTGAYQKADVGPAPHQGTVYTVAGNAGEVQGGALDHPAMVISLNVLGSLVLDIHDHRLDARMLSSTGAVLDEFTLVKGPFCPTGSDLDDDGTCDGDDNCPNAPNTDQLDADLDGLGDACDVCPTDPGNDADADGVCAADDNCPANPNPGQQDADGDSLGDACDTCPGDADNDVDGDEVCGDADNCPVEFNPCQRDSDGNGLGDLCDVSSPASCNVFVGADTWLKENGFSPHGNDTELRSRKVSFSSERALLRFDLSTVPAGATVLSATAWFFVSQPDETGLVDVHRVTDTWTEQGALWWNTAFDFDPVIRGSFLPAADDAWVGVDLQGLVEEWMDGVHPNYGVMFLSSTSDDSRYFSREAPQGRPCLHVLFECLTPGTDADGDGTPDIEDGCPNDPAKVLPGPCGCGEQDVDSDGDGTFDCDDLCPGDPAKIDPGICGCDTLDTDADADGIFDCEDACIDDPDNDLDGDGICGDVDNCPASANLNQSDVDGDGQGDLCDVCPADTGNDADLDGLCADIDNCPATSNASQTDGDDDGSGDSCDACSADADDDFDADGICGDVDNCAGTSNADQVDTDTDGRGDVCDSPDDADGDSVPDASDNCPAAVNPAQQDTDADGTGDACDTDDDGDNVADAADCAALSPGVSTAPGPIGNRLTVDRTLGGLLRWSRGIQGHLSNVYRGTVPAGQPWSVDVECLDFANPGTQSVQPDDPPPGARFYYLVTAANRCGESTPGVDSAGVPRSVLPSCAAAKRDSDADGVADREDNCPITANAGMSDVDQDFVGDLCDNCPTVSNPDQADDGGDGRGDVCEGLIDGDGDGIEDAVDNCPSVVNTGQEDTDGDGPGDACDACPTDPDKTDPGVCGCGEPDVSVDETVRDEFGSVSFNGNNGTSSWTGGWQELGESDGPGNGRVRVVSSTNCVAGNCMNIGVNDAQVINGRGLARAADLGGATSATLTFAYARTGQSLGVKLSVSNDGGSSWTDLQTYSFPAPGTSQSFDITPWISSTTVIRFSGSGQSLFGANFYADDIEIEFTRPCN